MELKGILQRKHKNLLKLKMISKLLRASVMLFAIKDKHHACLTAGRSAVNRIKGNTDGGGANDTPGICFH